MDKAIQDLLNTLNKAHGSKSALLLSDNEIEPLNYISSGSLALDIALSKTKGYPCGRMIEIFGAEGVGKTTLAIKAMVSMQANDSYVGIVDAEQAFDKVYAEKLGLDLSRVVIAQPSCLEEALAECVEMLKVCKLVTFDSIAGSRPRKEMDGNIEDQNVALHPNILSRAVGQLIHASKLNDSILIALNQIREKPGVMYGSPINIPGGHFIKHAASVRIELRPSEEIKSSKDNLRIGHYVKAKIVKNKVYVPYKEAMIPLIYGLGIIEELEIANVATELGIIKKSGSWYSYNDLKLDQGLLNVMTFLIDNPEIAKDIKKLIIEKIIA